MWVISPRISLSAVAQNMPPAAASTTNIPMIHFRMTTLPYILFSF
jgi:hypothetical protein